MSINSEVIEGKIAEMKNNLEICRNNFRYLVSIHDSKDTKHKVLLMLWSKIIKDYYAFVLLVDKRLGESAAKLLRSIYHSYIYMRWILLEDNVSKYMKASEYCALQMARALFNKDLVSFDIIDNPEEVKIKIKQNLKKIGFPKIEQMATETKSDNLHALIYPVLSAIDHGNMMFMGERLDTMTISIEPDDLNIPPFFYPANLLLEESALLCKEWIENKTIRELKINIPNLHIFKTN